MKEVFIMNELTLYGRLTRDPDLSYTSKGTALLKATIAVDHGKDITNFIPITAFDKTAETMANGLRKGHRILVKAHLQSSSYDKDGKKVFKLDVIVDRFTFVETKKDLNK